MANLFPGTQVEASASVSCGTLLSYLFTRLWMAPGELGATLYRRRRQVLHQTEQGISTLQWAPWLVRNFKQACVVLRKK